MKFLILLALVAGHAVVSQQTCDEGAILNCFAGLLSLNTTSPEIFDNFCDVSRAAIACAEPIVGSCDDETFVFELQKTHSMISDICTPENSMSLSLNMDCLTSPTVTTAIDSCIQTFFQELSSTDVCFLLDLLEACTKNVVVGCAEDLVVPYSAALVLSIRAHLPSIVICDQTARSTTTATCDEGAILECFAGLRSLNTTSPEIFDNFCDVSRTAIACAEPIVGSCNDQTFVFELQKTDSMISDICTPENSMSFSLNRDCLTSPTVTSAMDSCIQTFFQELSSTDVCFLLDPLEACTKNVVVGCAEDLVDPYSAALVLSIRAHLPNIVICDQTARPTTTTTATCDEGAILECFAGLRSLNTTSPEIFDNFCDASRTAIACAEPIVGSCNDQTYSELQKTGSMISDICTLENSMSFSLNRDCLTSPTVTTAMDSCIQTFFQELSSTDVCFLLDPLEACTKNVVVGCAEDLVDPYSAALVLSIRAHLPSIVICDQTVRPTTTGLQEMCNHEVLRCLSPITNTYFNSSSSPFVLTSELLASFCSAAEKATACFEPFSEVCKNHSVYSTFYAFTGYHQYICAADNRAGVVALGKCINDKDVFDEVEKCFDGFGNATDPKIICSDTKSSIKCSVEKIRDKCGQASMVVFANIVRQYTGPSLSLYLPADCDALELLDDYADSSISGAGATPIMLIAVTNAALVAMAVMLTSA